MADVNATSNAKKLEMEQRAGMISKMTFTKSLVDAGITKAQLLKKSERDGEEVYAYASIIRAITNGRRAEKPISVDVNDEGNWKKYLLSGRLNNDGELVAIGYSVCLDRSEVLTGRKGNLPSVDFFNDQENIRSFQENGKVYYGQKNLAKDTELTETLMSVLSQRYLSRKTGKTDENGKEVTVSYPVFNSVATKVIIEPHYEVDKETGEQSKSAKGYDIHPFVKGELGEGQKVGFLTLGPDNHVYVVNSDNVRARLLTEEGETRFSESFRHSEFTKEAAEALAKNGYTAVIGSNEQGDHFPVVLTLDHNGLVRMGDSKNPKLRFALEKCWDEIKAKYPKEDVAETKKKAEAENDQNLSESVAEEKPSQKAAARKTRAAGEKKEAGTKIKQR